MGYKIAGGLGLILLITISGSAWYIDRLLDQISVLKGNQLILETEIQTQNDQIKNLISNAEKTQTQINALEKEKNESEREVNELRNTFARHDLDNLALAKPGLIQTKVNRATKRVKDELVALTNPDQFEEENEEDTSN
tara:strand:- start:1941 stop:2354 length:414 start_codon:yes stop_codon:yes gene_type:complete